MKAENVNAEWAQVAAKAFGISREGPKIGNPDYWRAECREELFRDTAAALAAVIPLIQKEEREACAAFLDGEEAVVPKPRSYEMAHYCMGLCHAATAIRARGEP